jgi:ankyrin repeat protein
MNRQAGSLAHWGIFAAALILAAFGCYYLQSKLNDFEDPLLNAAFEGDLKTVERLVASGKSVDFQDAYGNCALTVAIHGKHPDLVHYLLERGAKANINSSAPPLHLAIELGQLDVFVDLLSHGANPDHRDKYLRTPTMFAVGSVSDTYLRALLDRGVDLEAEDEDGWRALHDCLLCETMTQPQKLLRLEQLIKAGADVNARNVDAGLKMSMHDSHLGSDYNPPEYGDTALEIALKNGFNDIAMYLQKHGAK